MVYQRQRGHICKFEQFSLLRSHNRSTLNLELDLILIFSKGVIIKTRRDGPVGCKPILF